MDSILAQLDAAAEGFTFPDLGHGYYFAIDARLHAYADRDRWALVVETVGYNPRAGDVLDVLHTFGNCLTSGRPGFENDDFLGRTDNFNDVENEAEPETAAGVNPVVRGTQLDVSPEPGEDLSAVFRRLVPVHRDLLLADEIELRRRPPWTSRRSSGSRNGTSRTSSRPNPARARSTDSWPRSSRPPT
ncbi:hypothetical protein KMZ30_06855 [Phycicoccus sp. KQZ13P-1]|nr:hypothetical protein [Phycicoccus mangrovi]MBT9255294.1 hypothetical protein [Phycicoccus mangrovi]